MKIGVIGTTTGTIAVESTELTAQTIDGSVSLSEFFSINGTLAGVASAFLFLPTFNATAYDGKTDCSGGSGC